MKSTIAIIIPSHNRVEKLRRAVKSVFNQTVRPQQLIVVDDGSTPAVPRDIFNDCPREIKAVLLRNEIPKGAPNARNRGIDAATSTWVAFLDDDDEFRSNKVEIVTYVVRCNPNVDVFYHPAEIVMENERVRYVTTPGDFCGNQDVFRSMLIRNEIGGTSMVVARRSALIRADKFDEQLPSLEDYELWLRMAQNGFKFKFIKQPLTVFHCVTKKASISKSIISNKRAISIIEQKYASQYAGLGKVQRKAFENWKRRMIIRKELLNGNRLAAFRLQMKQFFRSPSPKYLVLSIAILLSLRLVFKLGGKIGATPKHQT